MNHLLLKACLFCALTALVACEKKDSVDRTNKSAAASQNKSTVPGPESTAQKPDSTDDLDAARELVKQEIKSPKAIRDAVRQAGLLDDSLKAVANDKTRIQKQRLSAELKLQAIAAAVGFGNTAALKALGDSGAERQLLEEAIASLSTHPGEDAQQWLLAAQSMLASDARRKEETIRRKPAMELATGDTDAGLVLRTYWLSRLEQAVQSLHSQELDRRVERMALQAGNLLCPACDDAHHATPDMVTSALLMAKNKGGFVCDMAYALQTDVTPDAQIRALSSCASELGVDPVAEKSVYWGANLLVVGTLVMAKDLVSAPIPKTGPIASALRQRVDAMQQLLGEAIVLPTPQITGRMPKGGERSPSDIPAAIEGLGFDGQTSNAPSLTLFQVGPSQVRGMLRSTVKLVDGAVRSVSLDADSPSDPISFEALKTAPVAVDTGAVAAIKAIAERKLSGAAKLSPKPEPAGKDTADLLVDALAPSWAVVKTLDSLIATGFAHFRFLRSAVHGQALPIIARQPEKELTERMKIGYERPVIAHVTANHVDVWLPAKPVNGVVGKKKGTKLPSGVETGYRGKSLARLRIAIPQGMGHGLDANSLKSVQAATSYVFSTSGAGKILHITASEDALAADVLRVAQAFQESPGEKLAGDQAIWPASRCGSTEIANSGKSKCPTGVAVAFSKLSPPSNRGVTAEPADGKKETKQTPPKPQPTAGFCDKNKIRSNMRGRTGAFRFCYEKALRMQKGLSGRVKVRFTIGASGALVGSPSVVSATLKDASVHKCLIKNISRVKFDPPKGGTCTVNWPFNFQAKE